MEIKTKFRPGDIIHCMFNNRPMRVCIEVVNARYGDDLGYCITYDDTDGTSWKEEQLFSTKEELRKHLFGE